MSEGGAHSSKGWGAVFDGRATDSVRIGKSGDMVSTLPDRNVAAAEVQAVEHGRISQALRVISHIVIGRPPPPGKVHAV